jgi:lipid II:glycine glycyltransferase (peptidoglycan interpeptide bridge formation enzyme)
MLSFRRKSGVLAILHKYYCDEIDPRDMFRLSVYYQARVDKKPFGFASKPFYTILNALDLPEQEILKGFTSTVRNEIRRSERENVQFGLMDSLDEFQRFHNDFAVAKGTYLADKSLINGYKDKLVITCATLDQKILAAHAYLCDREAGTVRLLLSSNIRLAERTDANFIGRANKFLHFKDMIHFKENGYLVYDFGGIAYNTSEKQRQGINAFKQAFGGKLVQNTDYQSWLYWLSSKAFYRIAGMKRRFLSKPLLSDPAQVVEPRILDVP